MYDSIKQLTGKGGYFFVEDKMKAALLNLGCKVNAYETESMEQLLVEAGYEIVDFDEKADVYVVNTCTVTGTADAKSRQMIHRARKNNDEAIVVACGCFVQLDKDAAKDPKGADILIGNNHKSEIIKRIEEFKGNRDEYCAMTDIDTEKDYEEMYLSSTREHTRAFVKIQDGCNRFCSYCLIPYARGRARSRLSKNVIEEVGRLAQSGTKEIVLTGIHVSSFGEDTGEKLITLIQELEKIEGIERIRLSSLEPGIITEEFVSELSKVKKLCPHFHLSLQSGCDKTLAAMNRHYTADEYKKKCDIIRSYFDHPALTTDIIVGFPGETEEDAQITYDFAKEIGFYEIHVFKFSPRKGTKAASMKDMLTNAVKSERSSRLIALGEEMKEEFISYYLDKEVAVLSEEMVSIDGRDYMQGYTKEYIKAYLPADSKANSICEGFVRKMEKGAVFVE